MKIIPENKTEMLTQAGERAADIAVLDTFITQTVPQLEAGFNGGMLTYGPFHYKYASGREGDTAVICLAAQQHHLSIYVCATKDDRYLPEIYNDQLGKVSVGKSCIRFKKLDDVNMEGLAKVLRDAAAWHATQTT